MTVDPSGWDLAAGYEDGTVRVFDLRRSEVHVSFRGHPREVTALAMHGDALWSGSIDGEVAQWRIDASPAPTRQVHLTLSARVDQLAIAQGEVLALMRQRVQRIDRGSQEVTVEQPIGCACRP